MDELTLTRLWRPNFIVFVSSACTMIVELVAGRIIAPYVGVSLYTWTSVIGVVLAGISLGNYVGGRLADRWASARLVGVVFLLGGLSCLSILGVDQLSRVTPSSWSIVTKILVFTVALFFVPSAVLGTVSPVVAKLAVRDLSETGRTVGKIYAAGAAGSIVGTFATGFVLISWFGTHTIVWGVALVLTALGLVFLLSSRWRLLLLLALMLLGTSVLAYQRGWLRGPCALETNYFCIQVQEREREGEPVRVLILDRLVHSFSSLNDPTVLVYVYEKMYAEATAYQAERHNRLRALFIGGGGYTFPCYMEAVYPDSELHVLEIDPGVTQVAYDALGLSLNTEIVTHNQDARLFLAQSPTQVYDLILGDAFNDFSAPYHLTTREFNERVRAWLADDGLYLVNIVDGPRADFVRAFVHTMRQTFRYVYLAPTNAAWRRAPRSTFVIVATNKPLDLTVLESTSGRGGQSYLARLVLSESKVDALLTEGRPVTLTDRYAPVDQMLAPVVREEVIDVLDQD
jgi:spermidine synthase